MKQFEIIEEKLSNLRGEIIVLINSKLKQNYIKLFNFEDGITFSNEKIISYNAETNFFQTEDDLGNDGSYYISELDADSLLWVLEQVENSHLTNETELNPYGVYIILKDGTYISRDEYDKYQHGARGVLIYTEKLCHELDLFDLPEKMPWDEAVKHSIPSKEQWEEIVNHRKEVEELLELTGGDTLKDKWYWSSTKFSSNYSWYYAGYDGILLSSYKCSSGRVRPFAAFSL